MGALPPGGHRKFDAYARKTVRFLEFLHPRNMQLKRIPGQGWELAPSCAQRGRARGLMESQRGHRYRTAISLRCRKRGQKKVKRMASNCWTASVAAPSTAAPRQNRRAVGFANLGGLPLSALRSAGKSLFSAGKLPVSAGMPVEDCRKRGRLRRCGIGLHPDGPGQGVTRGEGMAGRLVRASGADRPHRRGGVESLGPFRPRPLSSSRAENFPIFKRNSNGSHSQQGCRPHQC